MPRPNVFLVCPGLGHVARGFETFTRECFEALVPDDRLDLHLYKGAGPAADRECAVWCLRRDGLAARFLGPAIRRDAYYVEQTVFALGLIAEIVRMRPDVIYFSDGVVGSVLWRWRRLKRERFKLLLSNGGQLGPPAFPRFDHVHQVSEVYHAESLRAGRPAKTQTLIPYGFRIEPRFRGLGAEERVALRHALGLPTGRPIVLSVGSLDHSVKRMDYVIREVASLPAPRPYLLLLGNAECETPAINRIGNELLGTEGFRTATVPPDEIRAYYRAADVFVLASLKEGFGRVFVEALAQGLPCLAHDDSVPRAILGEYGLFGDFSASGALAELIKQVHPEKETESLKQARHQSVYERFSWDRLRDEYVEMIRRCAAIPIPGDDPTRRGVRTSRSRTSEAFGVGNGGLNSS